MFIVIIFWGITTLVYDCMVPFVYDSMNNFFKLIPFPIALSILLNIYTNKWHSKVVIPLK